MSLRVDLEGWILDALKRLGGSGKIVPIAKDIWTHHQVDISRYPDGLFTWQYDMRWAGESLAKQGKLSRSNGLWTAS
jgi:hypothetical protein